MAEKTKRNISWVKPALKEFDTFPQAAKGSENKTVKHYRETRNHLSGNIPHGENGSVG
jgi:hypothetical protein